MEKRIQKTSFKKDKKISRINKVTQKALVDHFDGDYEANSTLQNHYQPFVAWKVLNSSSFQLTKLSHKNVTNH